MGHAPPRGRDYGGPPTRESFHLGMARSAYLRGDYGVAYYERVVTHVLRGGVLDSAGRIPAFAFPGAHAGLED